MDRPKRISEVERIRATCRPEGPPVMRQDWSALLFLHWELPAELIAKLLPPELEVDTFEGRAYVGLVPFTMSGVRPVGFPAVPWLSNFHEVNVRTYVHRNGKLPGVWFFSLDAANPIAVWLACLFFHLPYYWARMSLKTDPETNGIIDYQSRRRGAQSKASCRLRYRPIGAPSPAVPGSLEFFLLERYILYASGRNRLRIGKVHHQPYPVQQAELVEFDEDLLAAAGFERPNHRPIIHYASGVNVDVFPLHMVT